MRRGVSRSKVTVHAEDRPATRFRDIDGYESTENEVMEVVDLLKCPERHAAAGATDPPGGMHEAVPHQAMQQRRRGHPPRT
jgi:ATP-dependent Zn protease